MRSLRPSLDFPIIANRFLGRFANRLVPHFQDLRLNLAKAGKGVSLETYLSQTLFASLVVSLISAVAVLPVLWRLFFPEQVIFLLINVKPVPWKIPIPYPGSFLLVLALGIVAMIVGGLSTFMVFYTYPSFVAESRRDRIDVSLPYAVSYMSVLASAGIPVERIFHSLLEAPLVPEIIPEVKMIIRNIDLLGMDTLTALRDVAEKTPSQSLAKLLRGIVESVRSGGGLNKFLKKRSRWLVRKRVVKFKEKLETMSLLSDFFITLAIAGPLFVALLVPLMAMLGGTSFGPISSDLILPLTMFGFIPVVSIIVLLLACLVLPGE